MALFAAHNPIFSMICCLVFILCHKHFRLMQNNEVTASLRRFWELESIGIVEAVNPTMSQEEELAVNDFNDGLNFDGKNYEVRLPWKRDHPKLENNYAQAVKRLESIERKLKRDPEKAEAYTTAINPYVEKGFAEEVLDLTSGDGSVRYLPPMEQQCTFEL